jgi:hypothetical protein
MVPPRPKMRIYRRPFFMNLVGVTCSRMLHRQLLWAIMPGHCWIGWDSVGGTHVFIWPFGFRGSVAKLCWLLPSCDVISRSMVKLSSGEYHGRRVLENCIGGLSLCGKEELAL